MVIGKLIKPSEVNLWLKSEHIPNFCNDYRLQMYDEVQYYNILEVREIIWIQENMLELYGKNPTRLCLLSVPSTYDELGYTDPKALKYDRFCIEDLGFEYLTFEDDFCDFTMLCEVKQADVILSKLRAKIVKLKFSDDKKEYFFENRVYRYEQVFCTRCHDICRSCYTYCPGCGVQVKPDYVNWEHEKLKLAQN